MTLRAVQADPGSVERQQAIDGARTFLGLCDRHLDRARVRLVLLGGAPGTGTTTAARTLCDRAGWGLLRSDVLRRDPVDGTAPADGSPVRTGVLDDGTYDPADVQRTYGVLLDRAGAMLARGASVVLDASWSQARQRAAARALAQRHHAELVELRTVAPLDVATERVRARHASGLDESDATPALTLELTRRFEPWPEATELDTAAPSESLWQRALFEATGCSAVADLPRWDTPPDA
jgi:predicted kinase